MRIHQIMSAAIFVMSGAAFSQNTPVEDDPIVVTAPQQEEPAAVRSYVADITLRSESQVARFHDPICPVAIGLPPEHNAVIEERMRQNAEAAGIELEKLPCRANVILIVAENGRDFITDIRDHKPTWLGELSSSTIKRILDEDGPARAWTITSLRNEDGWPMSGRGGEGATLRVNTASILKQPTRQEMDASFIVIDKSAVLGLSLTQIADYATMRGFAKTREPEGVASVDTVLSLFDVKADMRPVSLTASDSAYLRALYKTTGMEGRLQAQARITKSINEGR